MDELKHMYNPPHSEEFIAEVCLEPFRVIARQLAVRLDVAPSTVARLLSGAHRISPEVALRLSEVLGRSAESWLAMQDAHDLWRGSPRGEPRPGAASRSRREPANPALANTSGRPVTMGRA